MKLRKSLALFAVVAGLFATRGSAQIFWSNYSPSGVADDIWCVTYGNGTFAAVTSQGNLLTSANGVNWSSQSIDQGVWLVSITYGNGTWVVVGDKGTILVSPDLKTWVHATSATSNKLNGVLYDGTIWVAAGEAGTIVTSLDSVNWVLQPAIPGVTGFLHGIAFTPADSVGFGGGTWICGEGGVVIQGGPTAIGSTNYSFTTRVTGAVIGGGPQFTQNLEAIIPSPATSATSGQTLVGSGQGFLFYSDISVGHDFPGQNFLPSPTSLPNVDLRGLAYGNGFYIAAGEQGTIFRSTDGVNWLQSYAGDSPSTLSTATLLSAAYSPTLQRFVVTGTGGTILVSNPPPTVFGNISTRGFVSSTQTFIGGFVIEGTAPRSVLIRADGPVLGTFNVAGPLADPVLTVFNASGSVVATNTGWTTNSNSGALSSAALEVGAFPLPNPGKDSALLLTLPPGPYTAQITSASGGSGIALFEAYTN
jgi:hypothetical protein